MEVLAELPFKTEPMARILHLPALRVQAAAAAGLVPQARVLMVALAVALALVAARLCLVDLGLSGKVTLAALVALGQVRQIMALVAAAARQPLAGPERLMAAMAAMV